jgi:hypothetical protein
VDSRRNTSTLLLIHTCIHSFHQHFPPEDAKGFNSKLRRASTEKTTALVPTINANEAQATVESDRVRIFKEIIDTIGMEQQLDAQLQEYLEGAMRAAAAEALVERGGVESAAVTGGNKE